MSISSDFLFQMLSVLEEIVVVMCAVSVLCGLLLSVINEQFVADSTCMSL